MTPDEYLGFLKVTLAPAASVCRDGAILFACIDWRHITEMIKAGKACGLELKNLCVWVKTNGGMGAFYRSQHELVTVWKVGGGPHTNTFGLGDKGRSRTNVWTYAGVNAFKSERMEELTMHPTVKPVALPLRPPATASALAVPWCRRGSVSANAPAGKVGQLRPAAWPANRSPTTRSAGSTARPR